MNEPTTLISDPARLEALQAFGMMDTLPEKAFDDFTLLTSKLCGTQVAMITFVDDQREWVKSCYGIEAVEFSLESSFGAQVILKSDGLLLVPDARKAESFCHHPLTREEGGLVSYAGVPMVTSTGHAVGVLCVLGDEMHQLEEAQILSLKIVAGQIIQLLEARQKISDLECRYQEVLKFAGKAAHDLKSPLCSISLMAELFRELYGDRLDKEALDMLVSMGEVTNQLARQIDDLLTDKISC
jgi:signal transduction histidine kinase